MDPHPVAQKFEVFWFSAEEIDEAIFALEEEVQTAAGGFFLLIILRGAILGKEPEEVLIFENIELGWILRVDRAGKHDKVCLNKPIDVMIITEILEQPRQERCRKRRCPRHLPELNEEVH